MRQLHFVPEIEHNTRLPLDVTDKKSATPEQAPTQPAQSEKPKVCPTQPNQYAQAVNPAFTLALLRLQAREDHPR